MAQYILSEFDKVDNILFLSGSVQPDYLRCLTLHGFKELLGVKCHDYPIIKHLYKDQNIDYSKLYGKGITYTNNLDINLHDFKSDKTIKSDITLKKYQSNYLWWIIIEVCHFMIW